MISSSIVSAREKERDDILKTVDVPSEMNEEEKQDDDISDDSILPSFLKD